MEPFLLHDITKPDELFGREKLLQSLLIDASLKGNVNIVGARRFGKTCLVKCAYTLIKENEELGVYPVYLDFKSEQIMGTDACYHFMIGRLAEELYKDGLFTDPEKFGSVTISPCDDWSEISEDIKEVKGPRVSKLLEKFIKQISCLIDKTILFIIDEYEFLFQTAFESPVSFMKIRQLSSDINESTGFKYFAFWLVGSTSWDEFCSNNPGSGEANTISEIEFVKYIDKDSFYKLWEFECNKIPKEKKDVISFMKANVDFAYEKSGGIPCYGKDKIGRFMLKNLKLPDFTIFNDLFKELTNKSIAIHEYKVLKFIAVNPSKNLKASLALGNLLQKGIINIDNKGIYHVAIPFLQEFLLAGINDTQTVKTQKTIIEELVDHITKHIETINNQCVLNKREMLFELVNDSSSLEKELRIPCYTSEQFVSFSNALYKIYFERTKKSRKNLHAKYFSTTEDNSSLFAKSVDLCRHIFGRAHERDLFKPRPGQFSITDLLIELTGKPNEPYTGDDFIKLQTELLKKMKEELLKILLSLRK